MADEYLYRRIRPDIRISQPSGRQIKEFRVSGWHFEWQFHEPMDATFIGIEKKCLEEYYARQKPDVIEELKGWFIVKNWYNLTREEIAEALRII
jgi:hypothetical protein